MRRLLRRIVWILRRDRADRELQEEIESHRSMRQAKLEAGGMSAEAAAAQSRRALGNHTLAREDAREIWIGAWLDSLVQDLRYAMRNLRRQPGFAAAAILTLAVGIGLNTTLATMCTSMLWQSWPVAHSSELHQVAATHKDRRGSGEFTSGDYRTLLDGARQSIPIATGCGTTGRMASCRMLLADGSSVLGNFVSANYFEALEIPMAAGRGFNQIEDRPGSPSPVAAISHRLWRERFGSSPEITQRKIEVDGIELSIVGVVNESFTGTDLRRDIWVPLAAAGILRPSPKQELSGLRITVRRKTDVSPAQARGEIESLISPLSPEPRHIELGPTGAYSSPNDRRELATFFAVAFAAVLMVLVIACANVGNLLLARMAARRREFAVRMSIGAGRGRLIRQLLTETLTIATAASILGLWLAYVVASVVLNAGFSSADVPGQLAIAVQPDWRVVVLSIGLVAFTCIVCALGPALHASRTSVTSALADQSDRSSGRLAARAWLLGLQVSMSVVLLGTAGTLARSVQHVYTVDRGFMADGLTVVSLELPASMDRARQSGFERRLLADAAPLLERQTVAVSSTDPFSGRINYIQVQATVGTKPTSGQANMIEVSPGYFSVLGVPLKAGRLPVASDVGQHRVVVNEALSRRFMRDDSPVGSTLILTGERQGKPHPHEVIGVVGSVDHGEGAEPAAYEVLGQRREWESVSSSDKPELPRFLVRGPAEDAAKSIAAIAALIEPRARTTQALLQERVAQRFGEERFLAWLAGAVGILALALASVGVAGVFAYFVRQRYREIGIRMALGARSREVVLAVLASGSRPLLAGAIVGLAGAVVASNLLRGALHGMDPNDIRTYAAIMGILVAAAALSVAAPAWRATHVNPTTALRND
jgi:predicted permease